MKKSAAFAHLPSSFPIWSEIESFAKIVFPFAFGEIRSKNLCITSMQQSHDTITPLSFFLAFAIWLLQIRVKSSTICSLGRVCSISQFSSKIWCLDFLEEVESFLFGNFLILCKPASCNCDKDCCLHHSLCWRILTVYMYTQFLTHSFQKDGSIIYRNIGLATLYLTDAAFAQPYIFSKSLLR